MIYGHVADDGQAQPGAAGQSGPGPVDAVEAFEDSFQVACRDAHSLVDHGDLHRIGFG
jgi:hypothetical protein